MIAFVGCSLSLLIPLETKATSYWIAFLRRSWTHQVLCLLNHVEQNTIIWGPVMVSSVNAYSEWKLIHGNTDNVSHVPILIWPSMTSSLTSHGSLNDITQVFFRSNSFFMLSFDINISHLIRRWDILRANQYSTEFVLYFNHCLHFCENSWAWCLRQYCRGKKSYDYLV